MDLDLSGKNALVCGGSKGIGKAAAQELAELGANVILLSRSAVHLGEAVTSLANVAVQKHDFLIADLQDLADLKRKVQLLVKSRPIHILVNNTGGPPAGPLLGVGTADFTKALERHLFASHLLVQHVLPAMRKENYGRIINVISTSVKTPLDNLGVSNTTRAAVANWAKTLANEISPGNITVNNVLPGLTQTSRLEEIIEHSAQRQSVEPEEVVSRLKNTVPLGRLADAREVAAAIAFLASPAASYIHGVNLAVDGGRTPAL